MSSYTFDVETFPNFFSASFINLVDEKDIHQFVITPGRDERKELIAFLNQCEILVGFNNLSYDEPLLLVVQRRVTSRRLNEMLYNCSGRLIADGNWQDEKIRELRWSGRSWKSVDLLKIMAFDKLGVGLKQVAINLGWHRIQDLPYDYDYEIQKEDADTVLDYNLNDVQITLALYKKIQIERELREEINQLYQVDVTNASDSKIANIILEKFYLERNLIERKALRDMRTTYQNILLGDCIPKQIYFLTEPMQKFLEHLKITKVNLEGRFKYKEEIYLDGMVYQLGIGGLHSEDSAKRFISGDGYRLMDADVASYYPAIMLNHSIKPAHLTDSFLEILETIKSERIEAKHQGNKAKAAALKITINSIFGKLGDQNFWLQDQKAMISVTLAGQLYLLMLIEQLGLAGIQVISANTDGILCRIHEAQQERFNNICMVWSFDNHFEMEFTEYQQVIRADVNNYLAEKLDGKIKQKGLFVIEPERNIQELAGAYVHPIVAQAIYDYFIKGIPVSETIMRSQNILDFAISQKVGRQFVTEYHTKRGIETLQKTNRFFVSKRGGSLLKRSLTGGKNTALYAGKYVTILNRIPIIPIDKFEINYKFYIDQCYSIIDKIELPYTQMSFV